MRIIFTLVGADAPGIVQRLASIVADHGGNWIESRMARLEGSFAGIVSVDVDPAHVDALTADLDAVPGLSVRVSRDAGQKAPEFKPLYMELEGLDRPGIIRDITRVFTSLDVNVEELDTRCYEAPMGGGTIFAASATLRLPPDLEQSVLRTELEAIAGHLLIDCSLAEARSPRE